MSDSQVIARKFRPKSFDQVVGQEAITRTLRNAITTGRLHHAYLFAGARGVGKTTTARILAKALNCIQGPTPDPCGVCASCREIALSSSLDVLEIDAASNTGVDNVRDVIINTVSINPARDRYKIFIIDEVHQLSAAAFNALLKTLEEPPSHVVFIMATTELHKVPETILSRCQIFEFRTITIKKIFDQLRLVADSLGIQISDAALLAISRAGDGSMRDAQSALDQVISFSGSTVTAEDVSAALGLVDIETLNSTLAAIAEQDPQRLLRIVEQVVSRGYDLRNFCRELIVHTRALLVTKIVGFDSELVQMPNSEAETIVNLAAAFSEQDLVRFFSILTKSEQDIRTSSQPRLHLEMGLMKLAHSRRLYLLEDALNQLSEIQSRLSGTASPSPEGGQAPAGGRNAPGPKAASGPGTSRQPVRAADAPPANSMRPVSKIGLPQSAGTQEGEPVAGKVAQSPSATSGRSLPAEEGPRARTEPRPAERSPQPEKTASRAEGYTAPPHFDDEPPPFLDDAYEVEAAPAPGSARLQSKGVNEEGVVEKIKDALEARRKMMLLSTLYHAESIKVEGEFLSISFTPANARFKNQVEGRDNRKILEEICGEILGRRVVLSVSVSGQPKAESGPKQKEVSVVKEQAEKNPAVRAIVDKFRGEIVEVIKPES